jgi:hypothetical protein
MTAHTELTGLTHYAPYPHTPSADYRHGIANGVDNDGMSYEIGTCHTCGQRYTTRIPLSALAAGTTHGQRSYYVAILAYEQAHEEALQEDWAAEAATHTHAADCTCPLCVDEPVDVTLQPDRTLATLTGRAVVTAKRSGGTSVEFSTEHYTFRFVHSSAWEGSREAETRTRLYGPAVDMHDVQQPPVGLKGLNPENDKAWAAYRRTEISRQRTVIDAAVAELNAEAGGQFGWALPNDLAAAKLAFSQKAGCSCKCSPGYIVQANFPGPLRDGYKRVSEIFVSHKAAAEDAEERALREEYQSAP